MNPLGNPNPNGTLITVPQAAYESNLSVKTTRRLAKEAGAFLKIGGSSRVISERYFNHICRNYVEDCYEEQHYMEEHYEEQHLHEINHIG